MFLNYCILACYSSTILLVFTVAARVFIFLPTKALLTGGSSLNFCLLSILPSDSTKPILRSTENFSCVKAEDKPYTKNFACCLEAQPNFPNDHASWNVNPNIPMFSIYFDSNSICTPSVVSEICSISDHPKQS